MPGKRSRIRGGWLSGWARGVALVLLVGVSATPGAAQTPAATLQVLVRTLDGAGVPGLAVTLAPQAAALGGPADAPPPASTTTDGAGQATFHDLRLGMWRVQLAGSVAGVPLQAAAEQARPPYGRAAAGGGFPVPVALGDAQEEGAAEAGAGAWPAVQQVLFVGQVRAGVWVPELDLGRPEASPLPITMLPTPPPAGVPTLDVGATAAVPPAAAPPRLAPPPGEAGEGGSAMRPPAATGPAQPPPLVVFSPLAVCYGVPILAGILALGLTTWRRFRRPRLRAAGAGDPRPTFGSPRPPWDAERG